MKRKIMRTRVLSLSLLWMILCGIFIGMLNFSENAEAEPTEIRITWDDVDHKWPDVYGDKIVWHTEKSENWNIYLYNITNHKKQQITTNISVQQNAAIYKDKIVWEDSRNSNYDIYLYDLTTGQEIQVTNNTEYQRYPAIFGNIIVWEDYRNGPYPDIYMYDLITGIETPVCTEPSYQGRASIYDNKIVWMDKRNGDYDIFMYDLNSNIETSICTASMDQSWPSIYDKRIVWEDLRNLNMDVYSYDLILNNETQITTNTSWQRFPVVYKDKIVWQDERNGNNDIYMYDFTTSKEISITTNLSFQEFPAFHGDRIVWQDNRNGKYQIYTLFLDQDNDGIGDSEDIFPNNPNEYLDTDSDGIGDNLDTDADNDGWMDETEVVCGSNPLDSSSFPSDWDGDLTPDILDTDDDNDGIADFTDAFPLDSTRWIDPNIEYLNITLADVQLEIDKINDELDEIEIMLNDLAGNISAHNQSMTNEIIELANKISLSESNITGILNHINNQLDEHDQSLDSAKDDAKTYHEEQIMNLWIIIVLLIIMLIISSIAVALVVKENKRLKHILGVHEENNPSEEKEEKIEGHKEGKEEFYPPPGKATIVDLGDYDEIINGEVASSSSAPQDDLLDGEMDKLAPPSPDDEL